MTILIFKRFYKSGYFRYLIPSPTKFVFAFLDVSGHLEVKTTKYKKRGFRPSPETPETPETPKVVFIVYRRSDIALVGG